MPHSNRAHRQAQAVVVLPDAAINANVRRLTALAAKYKLPCVYSARGVVDAGGLMAYGPNFAVAWRRAADYVDKILKGSKPDELPIEEPTQFELVVNLRTAKALKLTIPESNLRFARTRSFDDTCASELPTTDRKCQSSTRVPRDRDTRSRGHRSPRL